MLRLGGERDHFSALADSVIKWTAHFIEFDLLCSRRLLRTCSRLHLIKHILFLGMTEGQSLAVFGQLGLEIVFVMFVVLYGVEKVFIILERGH